MTFDDIITPKIPDYLIDRLKNDLIFIYCYSILSTNKNNLDLLLQLDDVLLKTPSDQINKINEVKEEIKKESELQEKTRTEENKNKQEIYL